MKWPPWLFSRPRLRARKSELAKKIQMFKMEDNTTSSKTGGTFTKYVRTKSVFQSDFFKRMRCFLFLRYVVSLLDYIPPENRSVIYITHEVPEGGPSATTPGTSAMNVVSPDHVDTQPIEIMKQEVPQPPPPTNLPTLPTAALREQYQGIGVPTEPMPSHNPTETPAAVDGVMKKTPGEMEVRFVDT